MKAKVDEEKLSGEPGQGRKLGAAVVGLGVGERHARMIHRLPNVSLVKIFDPNKEKADVLAMELGAESTEDFEDILRDNAVEFVVIASPDHFHGTQIVQALQAGKHVFAEKPLCNTTDELNAIVEEWSRHNDTLKLYSNLILRMAPLYIWLKKKIEEGVFGEIYSIDGDYLYGRKEKILNGWRGTGENYSGIKGGGIHLIDLMCWLSNQKPSQVTTTGNNICTRNTGVQISDFMSAVFRFESGMIGRITANLGCVHRHHHVLRIFGTKATFILDDQGPRIHLSSDPALAASTVMLDPLPSGKSDIVPIFINAVVNNVDSKDQTEATFNIVSILAACDKSFRTGIEEPIEYIYEH